MLRGEKSSQSVTEPKTVLQKRGVKYIRLVGPPAPDLLGVFFFSFLGARIVSVLFWLRMLAPPGTPPAPTATWGTETTVSVSTVMFREKLSEPMTGGLLAKDLDAGGALLLLVACVLLLVRWAALSSLL